jgi:transposase-like protein
MKNRCKFTSEFKSKVALEALREQHPIHVIAKRYQIYPTQVTQWKKELLGHASSMFESASSKNDEAFSRSSKKTVYTSRSASSRWRWIFFKTVVTSSVSLSRRMNFVEKESEMSIKKQCDLLAVPRSSYYHKPKRKVSLLDKMLMEAIYRIYTEAASECFDTRADTC